MVRNQTSPSDTPVKAQEVTQAPSHATGELSIALTKAPALPIYAVSIQASRTPPLDRSAGGDAIELWMRSQCMTFAEAVKALVP